MLGDVCYYCQGGITPFLSSYDRFYLSGFGDVAGRDAGRAALALDDSGGFLRGIPIEVDADDMRPFPREEGGGRLAVAPAWSDRARGHDDCDLVLQTTWHIS